VPGSEASLIASEIILMISLWITNIEHKNNLVSSHSVLIFSSCIEKMWNISVNSEGIDQKQQRWVDLV
jgi:hypothetical protein